MGLCIVYKATVRVITAVGYKVRINQSHRPVDISTDAEIMKGNP